MLQVKIKFRLKFFNLIMGQHYTLTNSLFSSSLGPGSTLGEKRKKKSAWVKKKLLSQVSQEVV